MNHGGWQNEAIDGHKTRYLIFCLIHGQGLRPLQQGLKTADWSRGCDVKRRSRSYGACGKLRMNDLVVNMADDRWPIGSCISAHFSNFLPLSGRVATVVEIYQFVLNS